MNYSPPLWKWTHFIKYSVGKRWGKPNGRLNPPLTDAVTETKHWWLLIVTSSAANIKVRVLCCSETMRDNALTRLAKLNEIQRDFCCSSANKVLHDSVFIHVLEKKFDECQFSTALRPHHYFIHAPFLTPVPVYSWIKLTLEEKAIKMKQCYGGLYSHFNGPQWYFMDATSKQPKQAIWKTLEKLEHFYIPWEDGCYGLCSRAFPWGIHWI